MTNPPSPPTAVGRFSDALLAADLPALDPTRRRRAVEFIEGRVEVLPSITRIGVRMIGAGVDLACLALGPERALALVTAKPLPLISEYPRLVRSLGYAFIWETWPDTAVDGAGA